MQALLVLEDGFSLRGEVFAGKGEIFGEVVFNTSMTGYQEMVTDPSYRGQILMLTCPLVGNYGVNEDDVESAGPTVDGFLVREICRRPRNWRASEALDAHLDRHNILGVEGIDTRSLTLHLRSTGTMFGAISTLESDPQILLSKVIAARENNERDLVAEVSCASLYYWDNRQKGYHVVVYDFGVKFNILRRLTERGCRVTVVPCRATAAEVLALQPDGVLLSNGPGDPVDQLPVVPEIKALLSRVPLFGFCLGHQLLALALGFSTFKLTFGHRGGNHPVKVLATGKVHITSQNHGYCVQLKGKSGDTVPTHINLNDGTLEGLENHNLKCFSVQYHPEAAPGPHDSVCLFDNFIEMIEETWQKGAEKDA